MASYSNGEATRKAILDCSRRLFFRYGYSATLWKVIVQEADVNPGLIHYHFKTKAMLAEAVLAKYYLESLVRIDGLFADEGQAVKDSIAIREYWYVIVNSLEFRRFLYEVSLERIPQHVSESLGQDYLLAISKELSLRQDYGELALLSRFSFSVETEILVAYVDGLINYPCDKLAVLDIKTMFELLSVPSEVISDVLNRSGELFSQLDIRIHDEFCVSATRTG
jgi:AcrR family transcriptional regulator